MSNPAGLAERVAVRFLPLGPVERRRKFGGWGVFLHDFMRAPIADGRAYLKVAAVSEARFGAASGVPFTDRRQGRRVALSYRADPAALGLPASHS